MGFPVIFNKDFGSTISFKLVYEKAISPISSKDSGSLSSSNALQSLKANSLIILTELPKETSLKKKQSLYLQLIIPQYFISNKSGIWSLSLIVHSKG